jgi:hypothetical protein
MAHLDMSTGTLTVNGQSANVMCFSTCKVCGQLSFTDLFKLSEGVTPKDPWFPVSIRGMTSSRVVTKFPYFYKPEGPFPQIITIGIQHDCLLVYSNSVSNSFIISSGSQKSNTCGLSIQNLSVGFNIVDVSL